MSDLEFLPAWCDARQRRQALRARKNRWALCVIVAAGAIFSLKLISGGHSAPSPSRASSTRPPLTVGPTATTGQDSPTRVNRAPAGLGSNAADKAPNALRKSDATQADQNSELQERLHNLRQQAAASLQLQSTVMGGTPKALVNGELLGEGDVVACGSGESRITFRVLRIEARRIIVEREGIKLEIPMKSATMPQER